MKETKNTKALGRMLKEAQEEIARLRRGVVEIEEELDVHRSPDSDLVS